MVFRLNHWAFLMLTRPPGDDDEQRAKHRRRRKQKTASARRGRRGEYSNTPEAIRKRRHLSDSPGAIRSRRCRARQDRGWAVALVEYDDGVVGLLVRHGWLGGDEVADPKEIGRAITAMLNEAARR
jgi:hypothetical protein